MGGVGRRGPRAAATGWLAVFAVASGSCATHMAQMDGSFRDRREGWAIAAPSGPDGYWRRDEVSGAKLAFRGGRGERISFAARCKVALAPPRILARHLRIGVPEHRVRASGPVTVGAREGWMQIFDARAADTTVRVKTVTQVASPCAYDWVLAAREGFDDAEPLFDAWWSSFQPPPPPPPRAEPTP